MINNSTNINKTNRLSLQIIENTKGLAWEKHKYVADIKPVNVSLAFSRMIALFIPDTKQKKSWIWFDKNSIAIFLSCQIMEESINITPSNLLENS